MAEGGWKFPSSLLFAYNPYSHRAVHNKENSLIGETLGEDRSVVVLTLCSSNFSLRRVISLLEIYAFLKGNEKHVILNKYSMYPLVFLIAMPFMEIAKNNISVHSVQRSRI